MDEIYSPTLVITELPPTPAQPVRSPAGAEARVPVPDGGHRAEIESSTDEQVAPVFPPVDTCFVGFRLRAVLGRGAFGQVYLAEQGELANRYVALKVAPDIVGESQTLAQLQHTNIVPIYSLHRDGPFDAVCMPFLGATTLANLLHEAHIRTRPMSGKTIVKAIEERKRSTVSLLASSTPGSRLAPPPNTTIDPIAMVVKRPAAGTLEQLERKTHVEATLWIGERIADGLAYAHEQGILHHDLKPANILLTESGQPMLLDFNLAEDTKRSADASTALAGGTLPYMAPEHLEVFRNRHTRVDARSDIYSLGVILYEMLAHKRPFPAHSQVSRSTLATMINDRQKAVPPLRKANPAVSSSVAAIVEHCLEADPARRYQSARELQEDLRRHRCDLPLQYAAEPSVQRLRKWVRRHPRLTSSTSVAAMLGVLLAFMAIAFVLRGGHLARLEAQQTLGRFREDARAVQSLLYSRHADRAQLEDGMKQCLVALAHFNVLDNPQWLASAPLCNLPETEQEALRHEAGELLYLLARANTTYARIFAEPDRRDEQLREAARVNRLAESAFGADQAPRALWEQRAELAQLLGNDRDAETLRAHAASVPLRTPRDRYLIAHEHALRGNLRQALDLLHRVTLDDPRDFSAWFVQANCYYDLLQDTQAIASYNACVTLRPEFHGTWFNRGLAHLRLRQFREAADDFDRVIRLSPDLVQGYVNRGLAREGMKAFADAISDYTRALEFPAASTRIYFLRAGARQMHGDEVGAQRDFERGLEAEPADEAGWIARGSARRERDPNGALADYEQALKVNPNSFEALQNKAALLCDKFGKDALALEVMERAVRLYPESVLTRGGRGVLLARAGRREAAIEDAKACLLLDAGPATQYQVACIYALTARQHKADAQQALPLLSTALRAGFGLEFVDHDTDLDALRHLPEFARMLNAARALQPN